MAGRMGLFVPVAALLVCGAAADAAVLGAKVDADAGHRANPIRKVIDMLQMMQVRIEEEGKKAKVLYDEFMCWCETADASLAGGITDAERRIPQLEASIKTAIALKLQLELEVKWHQKDREEAKAAIKVSLGIYTTCKTEKEQKINGELSANILALERAIAALEKGTYGSFLQTSAAATLRKLSISMDNLSDVDRDMLASFLTSKQPSGHYVPQSQEIIGILKQMLDDMKADLKTEKAGLKECKTDYEVVLELNMKRITASEEAIEAKLKRIGQLGVKIAMLKNDLEDTQEGVDQDKAFLRDLEKNCEIKRREWALYQQTQGQELAALADTIKVLNDDDTLELMKKTIPSAASSLLQVKVSQAKARAKALAVFKALRAKGGSDTRFDFLELALSGKKVNFDKVIKMIDELIATLAKEQFDDDAKKEYCAVQLDQADDKKKALDRKISDLETLIEDLDESIYTVKGEIEALEDGIKALDKEVEQGTEQRKAEHAAYLKDMAETTAAKDILAFAMNRLNRFYNPKLYKAQPKRELSREEEIYTNFGGELAPRPAPPAGIAGTGITAFAQVAEHYYQSESTSMIAAEPGTESFSTSFEISFGSSSESSAAASWEAPDGFEAGASASMTVSGVDPAGERKEVKPAPKADLSYNKGAQASNGVIEMIKLLITDLEKDLVEMEVDEKDAQEDYERFMSDSAVKRAADSKAITDKTGHLAEMQAELLDSQEELKSDKYQLMGTEKYIMELHQECDFLLKYYTVRKEARAGEVESLGQAKDVLKGADFSLLQVS